MAVSGGRFLTGLFSVHKLNLGFNIYCGTLLQSRNYAVRKGTRDRMRKKKAKNIEVKKIGMGEKILRRKKGKLELPDAMKYREASSVSPDNVWVAKYYKWKIYPLEEAVQCHREVLHPTMYNVPNAYIKANVEVSMQGVKKDKYVGAFSGLVAMPHKFDIGEHRTVLAFAKTPEQQKEAREAGATFVAGTDIIRLIRIGEMSIADFHTVVAHPSLLAELLCLKGIMKRNFPNLKMGTLGPNLTTMIYKHLYGVKYTCSPHLNFPQYGTTEVTFGTLDMDKEQLEENFKALVEDVDSHRPNRPGPFITRIRIKCPPNSEKLKIDHEKYIKEVEPVKDDEDEDDYDTVATAAI